MTFIGRKTVGNPNPRWPAKSVSEVLRDAAHYVTEHGWNSGAICDTDGTVCALGAVAAAAGFDFSKVDYSEYERAYQYIELHPAVEWFATWIDNSGTWRSKDSYDTSHPYVYIYRYNDIYIKTADELIGSLRAAADAWEDQRV